MPITQDHSNSFSIRSKFHNVAKNTNHDRRNYYSFNMDNTQQAATAKHKDADPTQLLNQLKTEVFDNSLDQLALGLGRPTDEIERWLDGSENIDEDAEFKIIRLADERLGGESTGPEAADDPQKNTEQRV